jgi:predicted O-linked N-acetylglucosamine transferase (SPINDLY family)
VAALGLDVLFYADIGTEPLAYFLSYARLAPVQCTTWGHPTTSGVQTIDYYFSHADLEPEGSERFYSEKLIRIGNGPVYPGYAPPASPPIAKSRREMGLPDQGPLYICPQSVFKLMPEFDPVLAAILRGHPTATLLVPAGRHPQLTAQLRHRWATALPDALDRVQFFPHRGLQEFCNLIAAADVVLDPHPVGGGITTFDALHTGTPVVTLPGRLMRSRFASACYQRLGLTEWIASDTDDYVRKALRLGGNRELRESLRQGIKAGSQETIYDDLSSLPEYADFLEETVASARYSMAPDARF